MLRKVFAIFLLGLIGALPILAQDAQIKEDKKAAEVLRLAFEGNRSYMGVEIKEVTKENFAELGLGKVQGVSVARVLKDSPADRAGLLAGDVIIRFNGDVITSRRKLTRMISEVAPDHTAGVTVLRNGTEIEIPVTIGRRPTPRLFEGDFEFPSIVVPPGELPEIETIVRPGRGQNTRVFRMSSGRSIGIGVTPLTKQLAEYFGVENGKGLLVDRVTKDSPAERAGIKVGDVIIEIDGRTAAGTRDLMRGIYEKREGSLEMTIIRNKTRQTLTVTPEKRKSDIRITPPSKETN